MIHSIKLNSTTSTKSDFSYINNIDILKEINFKPHVNILVGSNGSGKSTILNILKKYTFVNGEYSQPLTVDNLAVLDTWFNSVSDDIRSLCEDFDIVSNYKRKVFSLNMRLSNEYTEDSIMKMMYSKNNSDGEIVNYHLHSVIKNMFTESPEFDIDFNSIKKSVNDLWCDRLSVIEDYIKNHHIDDDTSTLIMDEPDVHLDVYNIKEIQTILRQKRDDIQIITSLHNPLLIKSLIGYDHINFIEMSDDYIYAIDNI